MIKENRFFVKPYDFAVYKLCGHDDESCYVIYIDMNGVKRLIIPTEKFLELKLIELTPENEASYFIGSLAWYWEF